MSIEIVIEETDTEIVIGETNTELVVGGSPTYTCIATDSDAIHVNADSEIDGITEKVTPASADLLIIEDSEDSNNKKKLQIGSLPSGGGGGIGGDSGATDNAVLRADGTGGATLQNSGVTIDDTTGKMNFPQSLGEKISIYGERTGGTMYGFSVENPGFLVVHGAGGGVTLRGATGTDLLQVDTDATAGNTRMSIYSVGSSALKRVTEIAGGVLALDTHNGWTGTFTNGDGDTVTVTDGIITGVA